MRIGRVILMMTILLALCFSAFAEGFNVLVYPSNTEIERCLSAFFPRLPADAEKTGLVLKRLREEQEKMLGEELAQAYKSEDEAKVASAREAYDNRSLILGEDPFFDLNLLETPAAEYDIRKMTDGDYALLDMVCRLHDADLLVMPVVSDIQNYRHLCLYVYFRDSGRITMVFEELVTRDAIRFPVTSAMRLGHCICNEDMALVYLSDMVDGSEVFVDGEGVNVVDSYVLCEAGEHVITLQATGYFEKAVTLELTADTLTSTDASLRAMLLSGLHIESDPVADVLIGGKKVGSTPLVVDNYSVPTSIRLSHEGYSDAVIGLTEKSNLISVSLKPAWMADKDILKEHKDGFYAAFARSLLIFGAKIVTRTLNKGDNTFLSVLDIAAGGALTVSVADMVGCLIDYYRQTEYISP